jgi:predicted CxxxxCH...CXXCH cytochrome family protein
MSQITTYRIVGLLLISGLLLLSACGSEKNRDSLYDADQDQHVAGYLPAGHKTAAQEDEAACTECHGSDYSGGISNVSCTQCHLGGVNSVHPLDWGNSIDAVHGSYVGTNSNTACASTYCHGTDLGGVTDSGPSCTSCHLGGIDSFHPASFGTGSQVIPNHASYVLANGATGCENAACHGTDLSGGVGPACTSCHVNGSPITLTGCTSCHGNPPSGSVAPNRTGAHGSVTGHFAAQVTLPDGCNTCHSGAGSGTVNHDTGTVLVSFAGSYNAKSGTAVRNGDGTCSSVSCHGGQTTPVWITGSLDIATQCTSCHAFGIAEYNSYASGQHGYHVNSLQISCVSCHDIDKLAVNHFTTLNTSALEGPAAATLNSNVNYDGMTCTPLCHGKDTWQ